MTLPVPGEIVERWLSGQHVGAAKPWGQVQVRRGHFRRTFADGSIDGRGGWHAFWVDDTPQKPLPAVGQIEIEHSFDNNGIAVCTIDVDNVAYREVPGVAGAYHVRERGWISPYRGFNPPHSPVPGWSDVIPNEWYGVLGTAARIDVVQGYGPDAVVKTFTGLLDSITSSPKPDKLRLTARDFGQTLTDSKCFGWNIDPNKREPVTFYTEDKVRKLERSDDPNDRALAKHMRKKWVIVDEIADIVRTVLRWSGLHPYTVHDTGATLAEPLAFGPQQYLIDIIKKCSDLVGYIFYVGEPRAGFPLGEATWRRPHAATVPPPVAQLDDRHLLTGLNWQQTNENKASIIRVRGKELPHKRGGLPIGGDPVTRVMYVYRPPWHTGPVPRDARMLKHVIHTEPLYKTERECHVACLMIALAEALASTTGTAEIPCLPVLQLDDVVNVLDEGSALISRALIASKTSTMTLGKTGSWKQSLGLGLLDNPDTLEVVDELGGFLTDYRPVPAA